MSVNAWYNMFFDIKKNKSQRLPCPHFHLKYMWKNLWIIVGVTDMKLDQLQYSWHWLRGVKWGMEQTIFDQD